MNKYFRYSRLILERLVEINTSNPPGGEQLAAEYLANVLTEFGFSCTIQVVDTGRANIIAELRKGSGPTLLYNGHLDVVPAGRDWSFPPFQLTQQDGKLFGRGSCDMKSGVAAMCAAAACIAKSRFSGTLRLLFVADEERGNQGIRHYLQNYSNNDYIVIGEPTNLHIAVAHRGICRDYITLHGKATHAALAPDVECNSVLIAAKAILALEKLNQELESCKHPILPSPSVVVTQLEGYESDNIVPAQVRLLTDFRIHPGMTLKEAQQILRKTLHSVAQECFSINNHFFMPGGQMDEHNPFVITCCQIASVLSGQEENPCAFEASCEQCFLHEVPTLICGPGNIEQAHTVDEFVQEEQLYHAVRFYTRLAKAILE